MTRDDLLTEIRHAADAESDARWPTPRLLATLDIVFRREWRNVINANPRYRFATRTPTTDANGRFLLSALSGGSGDTAENFYRIIDLAVGDRLYVQMDFRDAPLVSIGTGQAFAYFSWCRRGNEIQIAPVEQRDVTVFVNYLPPLPSALSGGTVEVDFVPDYAMVLVYECASMLMAKGGLEPDAMQTLKQLAEEMRRDMLGDVTRISNDPTQMRYSDSRGDWAGALIATLGLAATLGHRMLA